MTLAASGTGLEILILVEVGACLFVDPTKLDRFLTKISHPHQVSP